MMLQHFDNPNSDLGKLNDKISFSAYIYPQASFFVARSHCLESKTLNTGPVAYDSYALYNLTSSKGATGTAFYDTAGDRIDYLPYRKQTMCH